MEMRDHLKAIEIAARKMMPGEPCEEGACLACSEDRAVLAAISAALAASDEREREFERAREAWRNLQAMGYVVPWDHDGANYQESLDAYFNPNT